MKSVFHISLLYLSIVFGQQGFGDGFQSMGTSARMTGLAQAVVADFGYSPSYLSNPASLGSDNSTRVNVLFINQFGMAEYLAAGFSKKGSSYYWAVQGLGVFIDNIPERPDLRGILDLETRRDSIRALVSRGFDTFTDLETSITFSLAKEYKVTLDLGWQLETIPIRIPVGANLHVINKNLYTIQGSGIGTDFGMMMITNLNKIFFNEWMGDLAFGITGKHLLGTRLYWNSDRQELIPQHILWGWNYRQPIQSLHAELRFYQQKNSLYKGDKNIGIEAIYNSRIMIQTGVRAGFIQGNLQINFDGLLFPGSISYGFSNHDLGLIHRIGAEFEM